MKWVRRQVRGLFSGDGESGAVLVIVAISFISLLGIAAIAIDGGLMFNEKRSAQNAADHAALAAAWADCNGADPAVAADASVVKNGYAVSNLTFVNSAPSYTTQIDSTIDLAFAEIIGFSTGDVSATAVAECVGGSGGGGGGGASITTSVWSWGWFISGAQEPQIDGMFANGYGCTSMPCTDPMYNWSWDGKSLSGYQIDDYGANNASSYISPASCTLASCYLESGNFTTGVSVEIQETTWPFDMAWAHYMEGGSKGTDAYWGGSYNYYDLGGTGTVEFKVCAPGVYVFYGNVIYKESECGKTSYMNMTIIAYGWIDIVANAIYFEPYDAMLDGIVLASFSEASPYNPVGSRVAAIDIGGSDARLRGLIYAPNGTILDGSDHNHIWGSLVGESVWVTDNDPVYVFDDTYVPTVAPSGGNPILMH